MALASPLDTRFGFLEGTWLSRLVRKMVDHIDEATHEFTWKRGKDFVTLSRSGDSWTVEYQTVSRLLGPKRSQYSATHRQARFAAWDVMARVIGACHDEDEGLQVALRAAQWMRRAEATVETSA